MTKAEFYRLCRDWHGYLSAFAFIALLFFAATGILLNHPEWTGGSTPEPRESQISLGQADVASIREAPEPARRLAEIVSTRTAVAGGYREGEVVGPDIFARLQGVAGLTDIRANLDTSEASVFVERAATVTMVNELHRGEHAGPVWRLAMDVAAGVLIVLSVLGYLIFLSLRFRVRTALAITAASAVVFAGLFMLALA